MTIAYGEAGIAAVGTTSLAIPYPANCAAGNLLVVAICSKHPDYGPADISGWTKLTSDSSGLTDGVDTGDTRATIFYKVAAGGESGNLTVTLTSCSTCVGRMFRYTKTGTSWVIASAIGSRNTNVDPWTGGNAVTAGSDPGLTAGDILFMVVAFNVNICTMISEAVTATGITVWGTMTERQDSGTNNGNDCALVVSEHPVTTGTSSAAPIFAGDPSAAVAGGVLFFRMREAGGSALSPSVSSPSIVRDIVTGILITALFIGGGGRPAVSETCKVRESVSGINIFSSVLYVSVNDPVKVTEVVRANITPIRLTISDDIKGREFVNSVIANLLLQVYDNVTGLDPPSGLLNPLYLQTSDSSIVRDSLDIVDPFEISVSDSVKSVDIPTTILGLNVIASDHILVLDYGEPPSRQFFIPGFGMFNDSRASREYFIPGYGMINERTDVTPATAVVISSVGNLGINVNDTIKGTDLPYLLINPLLSSASDKIVSSDAPAIKFGQLPVSVYDPVIVKESASVSLLGNIYASAYDDVKAREQSQSLVKQLFVSVSDTCKVIDSPTLNIKGLNIGVSDSSRVQENVSVLINRLNAITLDPTIVGDFPTIRLANYAIQVSDNAITVDSPTVNIEGLGLNVVASDPVKVREQTTLAINPLKVELSDAIITRDSPSVAISIVGIIYVSISDPVISRESAQSVIGILNVNTFDTSLVREQTSATVSVTPDINVSVNDGIKVRESDALLIRQIKVLTSDSVKVRESFATTGYIEVPGQPEYPGYEYFNFGYINNPYWVKEPEFDNVHFPCCYFYKKRKVVPAIIPPLPPLVVGPDTSISIRASDTIQVQEFTQSYYVPIVNIQISDTVKGIEFIQSLINCRNILVSDTMKVREFAQPLMFSIKVSDTVKVREVVQPSMFSIKVSDTVKVKEVVQPSMFSIKVSDTVKVKEVVRLLNSINVQVSDNISVKDNGQLSGSYSIRVSDTVIVQEFIQSLVPFSIIKISDTVMVQEFVQNSFSFSVGPIQVSDSTKVRESIKSLIPVINIQVSDTVKGREFMQSLLAIGIRISDTVKTKDYIHAVFYINVSDTVKVKESAKSLMFVIKVSDTVKVREFVHILQYPYMLHWTLPSDPDVIDIRVRALASPAIPDYTTLYDSVGLVDHCILPLPHTPPLVGTINFAISGVDDEGVESEILSGPVTYV